MTLHLKAETEDAGTRLDAFVASRANGLNRSQAARYIEEGRVSVDGKPAAKSCRIGGGETVTGDVAVVRETALEPQDIPLDVVYEDEDVIVVNKPSGLVVHPAPGHPDGTLVNALLHHCGSSLSGIGGEKRPGIVHRIDLLRNGRHVRRHGVVRVFHQARPLGHREHGLHGAYRHHHRNGGEPFPAQRNDDVGDNLHRRAGVRRPHGL